MQLYNLIVLHCQVVTRFFLCKPLVLISKNSVYLVSDLHEETRDKGLSNVGIVLLRGELGTSSGKGKSVHDSGQLLTDIIGTECKSINSYRTITQFTS